jgi:hypothetical protein
VYFDAWFPGRHCYHPSLPPHLADYLQADEPTHVKLATHWIRELLDDDTERRDELVSWGRGAVETIGKFWSDDGKPQEVHFTFLRSGTG